MTKLNLGTGNNIKEGWINHDVIKHRPEINIIWNLDKLPWPWKNKEFDTVYSESVFEHLKLTLIEACDECWRILEPEGILILRYPIFTSPNIHHDPTHRWFLSERAVDYLDPRTTLGARYSYYTERKWHIEERRIDKLKVYATLKKIA